MREELLQTHGKRVNNKKTAALIRENGLNARSRRKFIPAANSNHELPVCGSVDILFAPKPFIFF
ncbi:MAG: hypothetical protein LBH18_00310 [Spirochaetaceae bacterium]|nr:hypothetical protein [Spirochaetaceae bacterium]